MEVTFFHPRGSYTFPADVDADTTGQTCLENLIEKDFLKPPSDGQPYVLLRKTTNRQILPSMTMEQAGVQDEDGIQVLQQEQGAADTGELCRRHAVVAITTASKSRS